MRINTNNALSFNARFINAVKIQKFDSKLNEYRPEIASFIEIESDKFDDVLAITNAANYWGANELYASNISYAAGQMFAKNKAFVNKKIYALTLQKEKFEELDDTKILGMAEVTKTYSSFVLLNHIQVDPDIIYACTQPFKQIGTRMLDSLKKIYNDKAILLTSRKGSTTNFYKKNGFDCIDEDNNKYIWREKC